jgi:hypothetical protein
MSTLKIIISLLIFSSSYGQSNLSLLKNWKSYPVPTNQDTLYKYNSDPNDWIVSIDSNEVHVSSGRQYSSKNNLPFEIKPTKEEERIFRGKRSVLQVDDGYLIGFYRGEWGGNLYWFSSDGANKYKVSNDQIVQFKMRDNKIYAIEGLAHLSMSEGSIVEIKKDNGKWTSKEYLKLPSAPEAIELDSKNNFIIVTSSSLLSIDNYNHIDTLIATGMWDSYLYPNSLVNQNDILFIGMRKGVFKYNLLTKKDEWLLPD